MINNKKEKLNLLEQTKIIGAVKEMQKTRDNHLIDQSDFNNALIRMFETEITKAQEQLLDELEAKATTMLSYPQGMMRKAINISYIKAKRHEINQ